MSGPSLRENWAQRTLEMLPHAEPGVVRFVSYFMIAPGGDGRADRRSVSAALVNYAIDLATEGRPAASAEMTQLADAVACSDMVATARVLWWPESAGVRLEAVGISRTHLTKIEGDEGRPGRETLMALATFFGVSLDWLATGHGQIKMAQASAQNEREALLLMAFRLLPEEEASPLLQMLVNRTKPKQSS